MGNGIGKLHRRARARIKAERRNQANNGTSLGIVSHQTTLPYSCANININRVVLSTDAKIAAEVYKFQSYATNQLSIGVKKL